MNPAIRLKVLQQWSSPTTDSNNLRFLAPGAGAVERSVNSKLADVANVVDYGADPTGATSSTASINAAALYAGVQGTVQLRKGTYKLDTAPGASANVGFLGFGAFITGSAVSSFPGMDVDVSASRVSPVWLSENMTLAGSGVVGSANQWGLSVTASVAATASAASYEKAAIIANIGTHDPGNGATTLRGSVGIQAIGQVMTGNPTGQIWGAHNYAIIRSGADGNVYALECQVQNDGGVAQPLVDQTNSKYAVQAVSSNGPASAAYFITADGGGTFHYGVYGKAVAFDAGGRFLSLDDLWYVDKAGTMVATVSPTIPTPANTDASTKAATTAFVGAASAAYTPTLSAISGTFTSAGASGRWKLVGKTLFLSINVTITTNGTAAVAAQVTLPAGLTAAAPHVIPGRASASAKMLQAIISASSNTLIIVNYDNSYPGSNGEGLQLSGVIEVN